MTATITTVTHQSEELFFDEEPEFVHGQFRCVPLVSGLFCFFSVLLVSLLAWTQVEEGSSMCYMLGVWFRI